MKVDKLTDIAELTLSGINWEYLCAEEALPHRYAGDGTRLGCSAETYLSIPQNRDYSELIEKIISEAEENKGVGTYHLHRGGLNYSNEPIRITRINYTVSDSIKFDPQNPLEYESLTFEQYLELGKPKVLNVVVTHQIEKVK